MERLNTGKLKPSQLFQVVRYESQEGHFPEIQRGRYLQKVFVLITATAALHRLWQSQRATKYIICCKRS
jgi:hypothetical protein